jgi:hypothetical protein
VHVGRADLEDAQQFIPVEAKPFEGRIGIRRSEIAGDRLFCPLLVDDQGIRWIEFLLARVFLVAENKKDLSGLAGIERNPDVVRANRRPAMRDRISRASALDGGGLVPAAIRAEKGVARGVEPGDFFRAGEVGEVVTAFAVLGLVVDDTVFDFDLADAEIALEVAGVVKRVPQAKLNGREDGEFGGALAVIRDRELPDLKVLVEGNEVACRRLDALLVGANDGVTHAVATRVALELSLGGLPGW